ncbi:MAG: threonine ammonia-lyase [Alphaproteobacteria bacterium]|nr:threonine ammonia-lyase [Alphaproteobacteria bacterium]
MVKSMVSGNILKSGVSEERFNLIGISGQNTSYSITKETIEDAARQLKGIVKRTPMVESFWLNSKIKGQVYLKLENIQVTGSFKPRGAYIKLNSLTPDERSKGVIAMSASNHAQGVAYNAQKMGIPATIVMPENTPISKVESTRHYGASVILHGNTIIESRDFAMQLIKKHGYTMVHPFDDPCIIAGQGTIGLEMLADVPDLDVLIVPVGGGGLAAGICIAAKAINPKIQIIGVQSAACQSMAEILFPNTVVQTCLRSDQTIADGIAVKYPGTLNLSILKDHLDDFLIVEEHFIETAIERLVVHNKIVVEGAGAIGVAAILSTPGIFQGRKVGTIIGGGNIDSRVLSNLLLRGMVQNGKLVRFKIQIDDAPGILGHLTQIIGKAGGNIFEISHQRLFNNIATKTAYLDAVVETRNCEHAITICQSLMSGGFQTEIMEE